MTEGAEPFRFISVDHRESENTDLWVSLSNKEQVFVSVLAKKQNDWGKQTFENSFAFLWNKLLAEGWQILDEEVGLEPSKAFEGSVIFWLVDMVPAVLRLMKCKCRKGEIKVIKF